MLCDCNWSLIIAGDGLGRDKQSQSFEYSGEGSQEEGTAKVSRWYQNNQLMNTYKRFLAS